MRDPLAEAPACGSRVPAAFRPPALASWVILRPPRVRPSLRSAFQTNQSSGPRRGCHVPHETATTGMGALCAPGTVVRSRPARFPRSAPAASQRPVASSRCINPSPGVLMTRRRRGFTCVRPSGLPQPVTPGAAWAGQITKPREPPLAPAPSPLAHRGRRHPSVRAIRSVASPPEAASTIRARSTPACGAVCARTVRLQLALRGGQADLPAGPGAWLACHRQPPGCGGGRREATAAS